MNELEKLNERISQLTDLVKSGEETISATKEMLRLAEQERDRLADQRKETEPKFERMNFEEQYYHIRGANDGTFRIQGCVDIGCEHSALEFENNNYFHTEQRATEVLKKINLLLKLERLHDTFCPDYVPNFNDTGTTKWYLFVNTHDKKWHWETCHACTNGVLVYFPSAEIAQKVCDILNAEERSKDV